MTLPDELLEAARIDGAGPMRFFWDIVLPLSKPIWRRCSSSPLSTAEPIPVADSDHQRRLDGHRGGGHQA